MPHHVRLWVHSSPLVKSTPQVRSVGDLREQPVLGHPLTVNYVGPGIPVFSSRITGDIHFTSWVAV